MSETNRPVDEISGTETTGHSWDGIGELDTPLPRWWLIIFYATIIWAVGYMVLYPAVPLLDRAIPGILGYSSRQNVQDDLQRVAESRSVLDEQIAALSFDEIAADAALSDYARRSGESAFKLVCVQCHGAGAAGSQELGYPNLNDDAWLWGGTKEDLYHTITHGVRNAEDADARNSQMPAYGVAGMLDRATISDVSHKVLSLSGAEHDEAAAERGHLTYMQQCAACHGPNGEGNPILGAPRLSDPIWLYGGTHEAIAAQVYSPRHGVMPPWADYFDEARRKKLAIYVHSLGGGH
ncbi:MAG: cytochrome-c oxidase, cbb3-type subunit III [Pseudomonadota bacterium]